MECKTIRILDEGPNGNYSPGDLIVVDKVRAAVLVSGGHAEYVEPEASTVFPVAETATTFPVTETTTGAPPEKPQARRRKAGK